MKILRRLLCHWLFMFAAPLAVAANLSVTISPAAAVSSGAQWQVDGGAWRNSGSMAKNLSNGSHQVGYKPIAGWIAPATQTLNLGNGTTSLTATYVRGASLSISLVPNIGQWRVAGGAWQASGASLMLAPGSHAIEYSALPLYDAPPTETVTLVAGGSTVFTRSYTSQKPSLRIDLTPSTGRWRIDGGPWLDSGTRVSELAAGDHMIDYLDIGGDYAPLASETVTLALRERATQARSYSLKPATLAIVLTPAQSWRAVGPVDTGWFPSAINRPNLPPGTYTVHYQPLANYDAPPTETITLAPNQYLSIGRSYTPHPGQVTLTLSPATAQWRIYPDTDVAPSGPWQNSGATLTNVPPRGYRIEYSTVQGHHPPAASSLFVSPGQSYTLTGAYTPIPPRIVGNITPGQARFRIDGGEWQLPDARITLPNPGTYRIEFSDVPNFQTPAARVVTLNWGDSHTLDVAYSVIPPASLTVHTNPFGGSARLNGGFWFASGYTLTGIAAGTYVLEFGPWSGYVTPAPVTLTLAGGEQRTYTVDYVRGPATLKIDLTGGVGRWRVDGGPWQTSGATAEVLSGPHSVDYEPVANYQAPPSEGFVLEADEHRALTRAYVLPTASVTVALTPGDGQWRVRPSSSAGGAWNASGVTVSGLVPDVYTIDYAPLNGFIAPPSETLTLGAGDTRSLARSYAPAAGGYSEVAALPDLGYTPGFVRSADGVLFGFTNQQGGNSGGALFRVNPDGTGYALLRAFPAYNGDATSPAALVASADGFIYGAANYGGSEANRGALFRSSRDGADFALIRIFTQTAEGVSPNTLLEASDGWLYGTTLSGALNNRGVLFKVSKTGAGYTVLKEFGSVSLEGRYASRLTEGGDGALYGTVSSGGSSGVGVIYRIQKDGTGFTLVKTFAGGADGANPRVALLRGSDGRFYGSTTGGGVFNRGTLFRLNADGSGHTILKNFAGDVAEGSAPASELSEDESGVLYGGTNSGGPGARGTVFRMNRDGWGYTTLKSFSGNAAEGGALMFTPIVVGNGTINGASVLGGAGGQGVLFKLNTDGSGFGVVKHYGAPWGGLVFAPVTEGPDGALYGAGYIGGTNRDGTVFKVNKDGTALTVLRHLSGLRSSFAQSVITGSDGVLYGVASGTSTSEIFRMQPDGSGLGVVRAFTNEGAPQAVIEGSDGALYGTLGGGGALPNGGVFKINKDGSGFMLLRSFAGGAGDGKWPYCGITEGADGWLYGATFAGGPTDGGTIFRIAKDGTGYVVLKHVSNAATEGTQPYSAPYLHTDGFLYGVMSTGGSANSGTIYRLAVDGSGFTVLHTFLGTSGGDGAAPAYAGLVAHNGRLYGVTSGGGSFGRGTIYRLRPDGTGYEILVNFGATGFEGSVPAATLFRASDGALYGTTFRGGTGSVIFRLQTN